jgi:hypothetical protein
MEVKANYSNVLSLFFRPKYYEIKPEWVATLNYNLVTGEHITLEDCFLKKAPLKYFLSHSVYTAIQADYMEGGGPTFKETIPYELLEDMAFTGVSNIEKGKFKFYIDQEEVCIIFPYVRKNLGFYMWDRDSVESRPEFFDKAETTDGLGFAYVRYIDTLENTKIFKKFITTDSIFIDDSKLNQITCFGTDYEVLKPYSNLTIIKLCNFDSAPELVPMVNAKYENTVEYYKHSNDNKDTIAFYGFEPTEGWGHALRIDIYKKDGKFTKDEVENIYSYITDEYLVKNQNSTYGVNTEEKFTNIEVLRGVYYIDSNAVDEIYDRDTVVIDNEPDEYGFHRLGHYRLDELNIMYNEIFARHGHDFKSKELKNHFDTMIWYLPIYNKTVGLNELNDIEKQNLEIIRKEIEKKKAG